MSAYRHLPALPTEPPKRRPVLKVEAEEAAAARFGWGLTGALSFTGATGFGAAVDVGDGAGTRVALGATTLLVVVSVVGVWCAQRTIKRWRDQMRE